MRGGALCAIVQIVTSRADLPRELPVPTPQTGAPPTPRWEWFCVSNVVAVAAFTASTAWLAHTSRAGPIDLTRSEVVYALALTLASLLYLVAFFGVAFMHAEVAAAAAVPLPGEPFDTDVVVVGAGTAGAALATVLARDGKRVVLIDRCVTRKDHRARVRTRRDPLLGVPRASGRSWCKPPFGPLPVASAGT